MGPATAVSAAIRRVGYRRRRGHAGISAWGAVATLTVAMHSGRAQIIAIYIVARARTFIPHPRRTAAMRAFMFRPLGTLGERSGSWGPCIVVGSLHSGLLHGADRRRATFTTVRVARLGLASICPKPKAA